MIRLSKVQFKGSQANPLCLRIAKANRPPLPVFGKTGQKLNRYFDRKAVKMAELNGYILADFGATVMRQSAIWGWYNVGPQVEAAT